jgi:hypothetical protein
MKALLEPILDDRLRSTHFFNGRLLSAEDLALEQNRSHEVGRRLGRAIGAGVARGLEVYQTPGTSTPSSPSVTIRAGLAISPRGEALGLSSDTELSLVRRLEAGETAGSDFAECVPQQRGFYVTGDGLYVLTIAPAGGTLGRAPVSGLGNVTAPCNARYNVEGVRFRLVPLLVDPALLADAARLRNRAAHACFGVVDAAVTVFTDPFGSSAGLYGWMDRLRVEQQVTDCDVPLTLIYWTARDGILFVDNWSVRRRLTAPAASDRWSLLHGDRRLSEAEAMFLQFQEQIDDMLGAEPALGGLTVTDRFDVLPPLGLVPISPDGSRLGFDEGFFGDWALPHVAQLDGNRLRSMIAESLHHEPFQLTGGERVQLYVVAENQVAIGLGQAARGTLVFTSMALRFQGTARFGFGRWNRDRYGHSR